MTDETRILVLIIRLTFLWLWEKLAINAIEQEKWWLVIFFVIILCVEIFVHATWG